MKQKGFVWLPALEVQNPGLVSPVGSGSRDDIVAGRVLRSHRPSSGKENVGRGRIPWRARRRELRL